MHEMSIAEGILDIALDYAKQNDAKVVHEVGLILGEMAGVEMESLTFSWNLITKGTPAEGAELRVRHTPLVGKCSKCGKYNKQVKLIAPHFCSRQICGAISFTITDITTNFS